jgi:tRNA modification GTPase
LAKRDVAIVTEYPGTTRDVLEVRLDLGGVAVTLLDTAGLRPTTDPVEAEGIRRAIARAAAADLVMVMGDAAARPEDLRIMGKADLGDGMIGWRDGALHLSATAMAGIDLLIYWLIDWARRSVRPGEPALVTRERHAAAIAAARAEIADARTIGDAVLAAEHLRRATVALDTIIGGVSTDDVLDAVFTRFCLGK